MLDDLIIEKVFLQKSWNCEDEKKYGYRCCNFVHALYSDHSWELIAVYEGNYYGHAEKNKKFNPGTRLKNKNRAAAIDLIDKMICEGKLYGKLLV